MSDVRSGWRRRLLPWLLAVVIIAGETLLVMEVIQRALGQSTGRMALLPLAMALGACMGLLAYLCLWPSRTGKRSRPRADEQPLVRAIHRSRRRLAFNLPFACLLPLSWWLAPGPAWLAFSLVLTVVLVPVFIWLAAGFRYTVWPSGLEISVPGWRLAFIPADSITTVEVCDVRPLRDWGGWGIRGSGRRRAFIWDGRRAVRLRGAHGEYLLGHEKPERLARTLAWAYLQA